MKPRTRRQVWTARAVAMSVDALQLALVPLFGEGVASPANVAIDCLLFGFLVWYLGFHVAFLPSFVAEEVPLLNLAPSWTAAVLLATRKTAAAPAELPPSSEPAPHRAQ
ncbi:MAG TPA: hypothetical protein VH877_03505 [Polyangia bacterium]|jgi:hypothetical protein|nr:hypothetical protein [Polyangia bacterium]